MTATNRQEDTMEATITAQIERELEQARERVTVLEEMAGLAGRLNGSDSSPSSEAPKPEPAPSKPLKPPPGRQVKPSPGDRPGEPTLEGLVLAAIENMPMTKGALLERFECDPDELNAVLAKLREEGFIEAGHGRAGYRRI